jgi:hypothetical protein
MRIVTFIAIAITTAFWLTASAHSGLRIRWSELQLGSQRPFVLNGLILRFDRHVRPTLKIGDRTSRYLVLVSSDECPVCLDAVDSWVSLLDRLKFEPTDYVVHVTTRGMMIPNTIAAALKSRNVGRQILRVDGQAGFAEETGLAWTPAVILLDAGLRVRLISSQVTPAFRREVEASFGATETNRR